MNKVAEVAYAARSSQRIHGVSLAKSVAMIVYARIWHGIGPRSFSLFSLVEKSYSEWDDFKSEKSIEKLLSVINPRSERQIVSNKLKFYKHCMEEALPVVPILHVNEDCTAAGRAARVAHLRSLLEAHSPPYFVKSLSGAHGTNAFTFEGGHDGWRHEDCFRKLSDFSEYCDELFRSDGGWILQPKVISHQELQKISSNKTLSTLRVITCLIDSKAKVLYALLKIATGKASVDNFLEGASGNMLSPVDLESGRLGPAIASMSQCWPEIDRVYVYPATGVEIASVVVPFWTDIKSLMIRAQESLPQLPTLGWDVAVTDNGPLIIEANSNYSGDLLQLAFGRGMKAELPEVLSGVLPTGNSRESQSLR